MITRKVEQPELSEETILIQKAQQDPQAFKPLYERYFRRIFLFVYHRVGDKALTADITSQVFLKAMTGLRKFQFRGLPFSAWLFRIAANDCNDFFRKHKRYRFVSLDDEAIEKLHEELTGEAGVAALHERLPEILGKLTPQELLTIELRFFEGRPFKEVADILGITENYAKVRVYRILDKMKKLFF